MRGSWIVAAALVCVLTGAALAAELTDDLAGDLASWTERVKEMDAACALDRNSAACLAAATSVQSDLASALTAASGFDDVEAARKAARAALATGLPGVQTAAVYALARLGPEPGDTAVLTGLLSGANPTLRRAAWGALKASPDPAARPWVERAKPQATGERWVDDVRPVDTATLGIAPPPGTLPVYFEMRAWRDGGQVFTADGSPDEVLAYFAALAGSPVRTLSEVQAWFAADETVTKALSRFAESAWYGDARVVALADGTGANAGQPVRLVIVWQDMQLGKTGFALQWVPANAMPGANQVPWSGLPPKLERLDEAKLGEPGSLSPDWIKPEADPLDTQFYLAVVTGDGAGARDYLETFPQGAYRAEVEAMSAGPRVWAIEPVLVEPSEIKLGFSGLPADQPIRFDVVSQRQLEDSAGDAQLDDPTPDMTGQAEGETVWRASEPLPAGLYEIRVFSGPREMDFDPVAQRRFITGESAIAMRQIRVLPRAVPITLGKADYAPGESVQIAYQDMPVAGSPGAGAPFFTIVKAGAPDKDWGQYVYTRDQVSGTVTMPAPTEAGAYEVRALFQEDGIVHGRAPFTVGGPPVAAEPAPTEPVAAPVAPSPVAENEAQVTIALAKPSFAPNEKIVVTVSGLPGNPHDFISVVPADASDSTTFRYVYTDGAKAGTFSIEGVAAGQYEVRVSFNDVTLPIRGRLAFEVK